MIDSPTLLEVNNVGMVYDKDSSEAVPAIKQIDLKIEQGEFICILGPSGCGKSTLLNIIAGFQFPTSGEVLYEGEKIKGPTWDRGSGFSITDFISMVIGARKCELWSEGTRPKKAKIEEVSLDLLEKVGLKQDKDKSVFELSGGMKQRVALARVLANQPQMILMDEPLGALDALTRLNMQYLIRDLWQQTNNTVIMITHDVDEALSLGTRLLVMSPQPGTIQKTYDIDFTYSAFEKSNQRIEVDTEYLRLKNEILDIINISTENKR